MLRGYSFIWKLKLTISLSLSFPHSFFVALKWHSGSQWLIVSFFVKFVKGLKGIIMQSCPRTYEAQVGTIDRYSCHITYPEEFTSKSHFCRSYEGGKKNKKCHLSSKAVQQILMKGKIWCEHQWEHLVNIFWNIIDNN